MCDHEKRQAHSNCSQNTPQDYKKSTHVGCILTIYWVCLGSSCGIGAGET